MDEIELVVKIPKEMVQELKDGCFGLKHTLYDLAGVICNGIVLPKGHGRIGDLDKLIKRVTNLPKCPNGYSQVYDEAMIINIIEDEPVIIEADKEGE